MGLVNTVQSQFDKDNQNNFEILELKRIYHLQDFGLLIFYIFFAILLIIATIIHPFFQNDRILPIRAKFPLLNINNSLIDYTIAFFIQSININISMQVIVLMDQTGIIILNQICLQFEILAVKFRNLNRAQKQSIENYIELQNLIYEHQNLIKFVDKFNKIFRPMMIAQLIFSMFFICLTAFETLLAMDNNKTIFIKFLIYLLSGFVQLLYWCWIGNKLYFIVSLNFFSNKIN